tara:strand:- start:1848 stop:7280 length:5433 start_codon:yes stop_codon:yes gene_type:complete
MATTFTSATLQGSYNDDFDKDKHYHQILFNNGRALQARELTQLQTLIYQEIGRFGRNIFKEGAAVSSGGMAINNSLEYVKIASTNQGGSFADIPVGTIFKDNNTEIEAKVLKVVARNDAGGFPINTLYIQYVNAGGAAIQSLPTRFGDGVTLFDQSGVTSYELVTETPNASGRATQFDVETGDFFVLGRFVNASKQTMLLSPYTRSYTGTVGFKVTQEVYNVSDDTSLYDNSGGIVNTASPGADRYRISLTLIDKANLEEGDTFVFLANIENSKIVEEVDESDAYNKINDLLAIRTDEESGDYVVDPFTIHFEDEVANDSSLELIVSAGTAYVNGYRVNNPSPVKLEIPRPQQTDNFNNDAIPVEYGNYFLVDSGRGATDLTFGQVNISTSETNPAGSTIGTCRVRAVEKASGLDALQSTHKVYVFDVQIDSDASLLDARSIGTAANNHYHIATNNTDGLFDSAAKLYDVTDNNLLMPLTRPRLESLSNILLTVQRRVGGKTVSSSAIDISDQLTSGESFVDLNNWIVASNNRSFIPHTANADGTIDFTDVSDGDALSVLFYVQKSGSVRTKTKIDNITTTLTKQTAFDASNTVAYHYYEFPHADIFALDSAKNTNSTGIDMLSRFTLDDGQRDNSYKLGRLILDRTDSAPNSIYVQYSRLRHNNDGDFFAASSYNTIGYNNTPSHILTNGQEINLFNVIDFRSVDSNGTFNTSFNPLNPLPKNGDNVTADASYYLARADKLIMTQEGEVQVLMGQQSANPQYKPTPENSIELFKIRMNPNTLDENDLSFTTIEHPHYTMKDISDLEAKVDRLEEYTRLNILELRGRLEPSLDSAGNERIEVGSVSDPCEDHTRTDTENPDHSSSLDPEGGVIRPLAEETNINLIYDSGLSQGIIKKGDNVYLTYDSEQWAFQDLASTFVKINSFGNSQSIGTIKLSPSSDEWKDAYTNATRSVQTGQNKLSEKQALVWNSWQWNWQGRSSDDYETYAEEYDRHGFVEAGRVFNDKLDRFSSSNSIYQRQTGGPKHVSRVVASDTIRRKIGNRYVDLALIPWIRSRKVYFHAKGLRPNTKFTPFFDGVKIDDWCREESSFVQFSDRDDDIGNRYGHSLTAHPDGSSALTSDGNGEIIGSFFIPSIRQLIEYRQGRKHPVFGVRRNLVRFRSGLREFTLLDIDKPDWGEAGSKAFAYYAVFGFMFGWWNRRNYIRWPNSQHPYSWLSRRNPTFSNKEVKERLDRIAAGSVLINEPKLSGKYGTNDAGLSVSQLRNLDNNNTLSTVLSDYVTVNKNCWGGNETNPVPVPENPLAQTFYVDNPFGLVLTKVDLFFRAKDSGSLPVSIHIRPVEDGKPHTSEIVPDSHVYLNASEVDAIGTSPVLSLIQSRPTSFEFDEPVYLQPWKTYAIVVQSESTEYELFSAQTQQPVFGSTSRTVSTSSLVGQLFLPQSGTNYLGSKDQDLMYKLTRAKFGQGGGSLILKNANLPAKELENNKLYTTKDTKIVVVNQPGHGHKVGDTVTLSGCAATNGIPANELNGIAFTITSVSHGFFSFSTGGSTNATATGFGGGTNCLSPENALFSVANLQLESSIPRSSSIDVSAKFTTATYSSGSNARFVVDPQYQRITPNQNIDFEIPRAIYNSTTETTNLGSGNRSVYIKVDLKSGDDYVSPIIDLQRTSLIAAGYAIDNPDNTPSLILDVPETNPSGGSSASKHITTPVRLPEPAVGLDCRIEANLPDSADVDFYFRTADADEDITTKYWIKQLPVKTLPRRNDKTYERMEFLPGGRNGTLKPFYQSQGKFVFKGGDKTPSIKNLQIKFLGE